MRWISLSIWRDSPYPSNPSLQNISSHWHQLSISVPHICEDLSWSPPFVISGKPPFPLRFQSFAGCSVRMIFLTRTSREYFRVSDKWGECKRTTCFILIPKSSVSRSPLLTSFNSFIQFPYYYLNRHLPTIYQNAGSRVIIFLKIKMTPLFFLSSRC